MIHQLKVRLFISLPFYGREGMIDGPEDMGEGDVMRW